VNAKFNAGKLNRRVTILQRVQVTEERYGTKTGSWVALVKLWAEVLDVLPSRASGITEEIEINARPARLRMRWRDDVTQDNRIEIDGVQMRIVSGPAMIGLKVGMEFMVEQLSTEGQQP
jgi:SPP1 family predicted phage head-tail adaptor